MSALAIELNDFGIVVADDSGVLAVEPGVALVDRGAITTGQDAYRQARLKPRQTSNRFWSALSMEPGSAGIEAAVSSAELAFAQLHSLWQRFGASATEVILVVPGNFRGEQLGLLLGLAQEAGMPVRALVDTAVAASVRPYPNHQLLYVDASLFRVAVTVIDQGADAAVLAEQELTTTGLASVREAFSRRFAEVFVRVTRLNPFHHADMEQEFYDRSPGWLEQLHDKPSVECTLKHRDEEFRVTLEREALLTVAAGFYRAVLQLIAQTREPGRALAVQLSSRLGQLPGLITELGRLDDARIERLEQGHAARAALLAANELLATGKDGIKLLKHLEWRAPAAQVERAVVAAAPAPRSVAGSEPTHVVYRGVVYRADAQGLVIGREPIEGRRTIVVDDQASGVSREHCVILLRDGELKLQDLSRYGTFVNEKRVSGEATLHRADVIRIGTPGAELEIVSMESAHAA